MKNGLHLNTSQNMAMTPQLLQSIRMLQLSSLEMEMELRAALDRNVMLEVDEDEQQTDAEAPAEASTAESTEEPVTGCDILAPTRVEADYDWSSSESWSGGEPQNSDGGDEDEAIDARRAAPVQTDARIAALEQLRLVINDEDDARIASAIIENIDDNGYLEMSLQEIYENLPDDLPASLLDMERVLALVQTVEPSGFGARDLRECLLLQLHAMSEDTAGRDVAIFLVSACLERLSGGSLADVRDALQVSHKTMKQAVNLVLALNPKPGASLAAEALPVEPEVMVSHYKGEWKVELNSAALPRVRINNLYERALNGTPHRALRDQLQEARWLIRGLEMRHETLLKTTRAIFERQQDFLKRGEEGMKPLTLREIADAIGMHESTVCRITTSKYVQTPWGTYELKDFFPSQVNCPGGDKTQETSGTAVKAVIRRIIDAENRNQPLCDGAIAALLLRQGIRIARRTVAKYREAMRIPPAKERHQRMPSRAARLTG